MDRNAMGVDAIYLALSVSYLKLSKKVSIVTSQMYQLSNKML